MTGYKLRIRVASASTGHPAANFMGSATVPVAALRVSRNAPERAQFRTRNSGHTDLFLPQLGGTGNLPVPPGDPPGGRERRPKNTLSQFHEPSGFGVTGFGVSPRIVTLLQQCHYR